MKTEREIADKQAGFQQRRGTRDQITNLRILVHKAREHQQPTFPLLPIPIPKLKSYSHSHEIPIPTGNLIPMIIPTSDTIVLIATAGRSVKSVHNIVTYDCWKPSSAAYLGTCNIIRNRPHPCYACNAAYDINGTHRSLTLRTNDF